MVKNSQHFLVLPFPLVVVLSLAIPSMKNPFLKIILVSISAAILAAVTHAQGQANESSILYIDQMDNSYTNAMGGRNSTYMQAPSSVSFSKSGKYGRGKKNPALKIKYNKKNTGGPRDDGGFCGFYTIVKTGKNGYLDASAYQYLTFWVKGKTGNERFKVGASDQMWEKLDDSFKSQEVGNYLPAGKITTDWQLATIPTEEFFIDWELLNALAICFEADIFEDGSGKGVVFIDDIALRK